MYESKVTGEVGNIGYVLRNLISRGQNGLFLNLRWHRICKRESLYKKIFRYIENHTWAKITLLVGIVFDCLMWAIVIGGIL